MPSPPRLRLISMNDLLQADAHCLNVSVGRQAHLKEVYYRLDLKLLTNIQDCTPSAVCEARLLCARLLFYPSQPAHFSPSSARYSLDRQLLARVTFHE